MARLICTNEEGTHSDWYVDVSPIPPSEEAAHSYDIVFQHGLMRIESRHDVADWQLGHRIMIRLAATFTSVSDLLKLPVETMHLTDSGYPKIDQRWSAFVDHYWLKVAISWTCYRKLPSVHVHLFLENRSLGNPEEDISFPDHLYHVIHCSPEAARQFGDTLLHEVLQAAQARIDYGLAIPDDYDFLGLPFQRA